MHRPEQERQEGTMPPRGGTPGEGMPAAGPRGGLPRLLRLAALLPLLLLGAAGKPPPADAGGGYAAPPQGGYAAPPQGGYAAPPQGGYAAPPQGGYAAPPQGGYAAPPQGGYASPGTGRAMPAYPPRQLAATRFHAVLVAGDGSLPVFDNAVSGVQRGLLAAGVPPAAMQRLSSQPAVVAEGQARPASVPAVLAAVAAMRPGPGEGCLVFATSHGAHNGGFIVGGSTGGLLFPAQLDAALQQGCGDAPTVVVISACFSGGFARGPMARPNRIVLTAARPDRPSFGCGAGYTHTVFDGCLLGALDRDAASGWVAVGRATRGCVERAEAEMGERPSEPQAYVGPAVAEGLAVPFRAGTLMAAPAGPPGAGTGPGGKPGRAPGTMPVPAMPPQALPGPAMPPPAMPGPGGKPMPL
ncbi:hypothetical protein M0638_20830 [Roseomonas sp. NAR14]|uniref:Peptidase C13-like protein n=1 Tax=Roseomonas acroporae TaxID=2937791 RepID=A0A9X2BX48_9PROT|nr:C13 family peptidase [Roseomonas acroporae]MCK8786821.1 hypothetical protein [Roseomonas acroporae]